MFSFLILSNLLNIGKNCCELRRIAERKKRSFARFVFRFCTFRFCDYKYFEENVFFPNRRCGAQEDGKLYLCLSQKDGKGYPFIWCEGKKMPYKFQGELTGICITAPN